ncbi:hypothetical protein DSO57_1004162 [Entomophthora muscae]|uniref:Uncharacterized protein n=1 Tax=Entomophthora muscae TaxID=34485 RepID=A0ACC2UH73_9FUNG|nr:hypothetical protein DSO57_1004162 [Entomophthora muscae]
MHNKLQFDDQVVVVTGGGRGVGKALAIMYARRGARVVVNDTGCSVDGEGKSRYHADSVVWKILSFGGLAIANYSSTTEARKLIYFTLTHFGKIDVLVCCAGIVENNLMGKMDLEMQNRCMDVHLYATRDLIVACWPYFCERGYGRVAVAVDHESRYGLAYCTSKMATLGFIRSLSRHIDVEGIQLNAFTPIAITRINYKDHDEIQYSPKRVTPLVAYLTHSDCRESGGLFEVGGGRHNKIELCEKIAFDFERLAPDSLSSLERDLSLSGKTAMVSGGRLADKISKLLARLGARLCTSHGTKIDILINCCDTLAETWSEMCKANLDRSYSLLNDAWPDLNPNARIVNIAPMTLDTPARETLDWALHGLSSALTRNGIVANTLTGIIDDDPKKIAIWAACLLAHPHTNCNGVMMQVCDQRLSCLHLQRSQGLDLSQSNLVTWQYDETIKQHWSSLVSFEDQIRSTGSLSDLIPHLSPYPSPKSTSTLDT